MVHAELERLACHLDVIVRLADGAGLAVATARFGWHKEQVLRVVSQLCGSSFGRGVAVPGGVGAAPMLAPGDLLAAVGEFDRRVSADLRELTGTASFLDRLRRTGPLTPDRAREHGALGPIGRASGATDDARQTRPYDGYGSLSVRAASLPDGDALARLDVRVDGARAVLPPAAAGGRRTGRGGQRSGRGPLGCRATSWLGATWAGRKRHRVRCCTT